MSTYPIRVSFTVDDAVDAYLFGQAFALLMNVKEETKIWIEPQEVNARRLQFCVKMQEAMFRGQYEPNR